MESIGAAKFLSPEATIKAARLVRRGKVYPLGQLLSTDILQLDDNRTIAHGRRFKVSRLAQVRPGSGSLSESVEFPTHTGTHIDAVGHWYKDDHVFGGKSVQEVWTSTEGLSTLGLEYCPPLVTRGVMLDVATYRGVEMLESGVEIHSDELGRVASQSGVTVQAGDVALIRTGWCKLWDRRDLRYINEEPGLGGEGVTWLADQGVVAIGADNWAIDVIPHSQPRARPVHEICLAERGIYLIENLNLEALAEERIYEFLFVALPPRLKGGTAFPIEPIAVV